MLDFRPTEKSHLMDNTASLPTSKRVLIVEDQRDIADLIALHLKDLGLEVEVANDGVSGEGLALQGTFDALVLDIMLPGKNGLDILRTLRQNGSETPVLMLTARATELDRVLGLELGADDYLTKPFSVPELQARVKALLRRSSLSKKNQAQSTPQASPSQEKLSFGELSIDTVSRIVILNGKSLDLTAKEFELLLHFAKQPGRAFTRLQLLDAVWGTTFEGYEHNVNTHINRLRNKVERNPAEPQFIITVRGVGYRFMS
jgi:DNA-binding response OmpR family regulator